MVNISSVFGLTAQPLMSGYNASKYGVRGFTEPLRQDLELEKSFVTPPAKAADVVVEAVRRGKWRVLVGPDARVFDAMARIAPAGYQRLITAIVRSRGRDSR